MQFFHLFSFVVVASHAAALPQPAELPEKYSSNIDVDLVSILETRSYQPALDSYKDSDTLMLLKRQVNSGGSSGGNGGSNPSPSATTSKDKSRDPFATTDVITINLASTIEQVGEGVLNIYEGAENVGEKIGGYSGNLAAEYLRKDTYVGLALSLWTYRSVTDILYQIKSILGSTKYSEIEKDLTGIVKELEARFGKEATAISAATKRILEGVGSVIDNFQTIHRSDEIALLTRVTLLWELRKPLVGFREGATLMGHLVGIIKVVNAFIKEQKKIYVEIMKGFRTASS
ncbi:hypothetical protein BASA50_004641 [Batrachochytrium salamandrivorans]|uniref:Uncharacterized protein n=1 Tax=Batrachochytrium salamandrivorans TaxID=1357716 RepID=A0ABQ8FF93_9FUNG|nr:hypothetical protein BASA62_007676 [Batrachochytrium salamandrivorans]KAH6567253.1 hypothetical protein BASA60_009117 [Batrachochytrium salamandrivorans]KAH6582469.1 hypothetical protein BASA61_008498 [Batrachochytrium salamandrivorans]KAH6597289.1 hypothetical protein BASA50_004641 [Batrachochytrium salamandrivorans]KAH9246376.1 hypothetical protein BASA81_016066 [Batrachochytrium salamandrivorans]